VPLNCGGCFMLAGSPNSRLGGALIASNVPTASSHPQFERDARNSWRRSLTDRLAGG
jgi:hypothetical protein